MSSGVPPSPPVTIRWSTRGASRRTNVDDPVELVGHRRAQDDLHAELLEPPRKPRGVRVLGVARHDLVPDRQDGGEHMTSMTIREVSPERDAESIVALIRASSPTAVITPESWQHRTATVPERAQLQALLAEEAGLTVGYVHAFLNFFTEGSTTAYVTLDVRTSHRRRGARIEALRARRRACTRAGRYVAAHHVRRERARCRLRPRPRVPRGARRDEFERRPARRRRTSLARGRPAARSRMPIRSSSTRSTWRRRGTFRPRSR